MYKLLLPLLAGLLSAHTISFAGNHYDPKKSHAKSIAGIYQGTIPGFNEPIVLRLDADGNAQYITTPELLRETTALGTWKYKSSKGHTKKIKIVTVVYIQDEFCGETFSDPLLIDCVIYGGGVVSIASNGKLTGPYSFSIAPSADPDNVVDLGDYSLDLKRQPMKKLFKKATSPNP